MQLNICLLKKALIFSVFFYAWLFQSYGLAAGACPPQHIDDSARVNYVYDGDTLQLEDGRKIRLLGIDTPEIFTKHGVLPEEIKRSGEAAKEALKRLLNKSNQRVGLSFGAQRFDHYQRALAHVFLPNGTNVQAALIEQGRAIAFTTPPNDRMSHCYQQLEAQAIKQQLGIWSLPQYQLKTTDQLNQASEGFHRLSAQVTRVWKNNHSVTLVLDNRVSVNIRRYDMANFNVHMLNNLEHKKIQIRGWLHVKNSVQNTHQSAHQGTQNKTQFSLRLRHPDAIRVLH